MTLVACIINQTNLVTLIIPGTSQKEGHDNQKDVTEKGFTPTMLWKGLFFLGFTVAVSVQLRMCFVSSTTTVTMHLDAYSGRALGSPDLVSKE